MQNASCPHSIEMFQSTFRELTRLMLRVEYVKRRHRRIRNQDTCFPEYVVVCSCHIDNESTFIAGAEKYQANPQNKTMHPLNLERCMKRILLAQYPLCLPASGGIKRSLTERTLATSMEANCEPVVADGMPQR